MAFLRKLAISRRNFLAHLLVGAGLLPAARVLPEQPDPDEIVEADGWVLKRSDLA